MNKWYIKYAKGKVYCKTGSHYIRLGEETFTRGKDDIWCTQHEKKCRSRPKRMTEKFKFVKFKRIYL